MFSYLHCEKEKPPAILPVNKNNIFAATWNFRATNRYGQYNHDIFLKGEI